MQNLLSLGESELGNVSSPEEMVNTLQALANFGLEFQTLLDIKL